MDEKEVKKIIRVRDNYTGELAPKSALTSCYIDLELTRGFSSKPVMVLMNNTTYPFCSKTEGIKRSTRYTNLMEGSGNKTESLPTLKREDPKIYTVNRHPAYKQTIEGLRSLPHSKITESMIEHLSYTFGIELECSSGIIAEDLTSQFGFLQGYDGSCTGPEYISVPMHASHLDNVEQFLMYFRDQNLINHKCSTHIHLGGIPFSKENFISIVLLVQRLQEELFLLVPAYKKDLRAMANGNRQEGHLLSKDYCKYIPKFISGFRPNLIDKGKFNKVEIDKLFEEMVIYFTENRVRSKDIEEKTNAIQQYKDMAKWDQHGRYHCFNFLNYLLSEGTIEFRMMEATGDFQQVAAWLFIFNAIVKYSIERKEEIFDRKNKIELSDVINYVYQEDDFVKKGILNFISHKEAQYFKLINVGDIGMNGNGRCPSPISFFGTKESVKLEVDLPLLNTPTNVFITKFIPYALNLPKDQTREKVFAAAPKVATYKPTPFR